MNKTILWLVAIFLVGVVEVVGAQQPAKIPKIGWLSPSSAASSTTIDLFQREFRKLGYVDGKNVAFESRHADDNLDRLGTGLGEEAAGKVTVLVPSMPIRIEIQAPGYEDWYYGGNGTSEQALSLCLVPGTTEEIEALLTQKRQKEVTGSP